MMCNCRDGEFNAVDRILHVNPALGSVPTQYKLNVVFHNCHLSTGEVKEEDQKFKAMMSSRPA